MLLQIEFTNWFWLVISILTVWRLTSLLCYEEGPFKIFNKVRRYLYKLNLGSLVECFHCMAIWVSICIVVLMYPIKFEIFLIIFAVAGGASIIERRLVK
ncbi:MAG: DUF1360 domain-containing protein [Saprospiraceae bacterium]|nr:DUF1360 domain-containing protein [Saprospiraceae bacterium]